MSRARNRAEWLRVGVAVSWIKGIDPLAVIPPDYWPEREKEPEPTPEEAAAESARAWRVLDRFLTKLSAQRGK